MSNPANTIHATSVPRAVRIAAGHVNVSARQTVSPGQFLAALTRQSRAPAALAAVEAFFHEADPAELADIVASQTVSFAALADLAAELLPPLHPNRVYLGQFAA